MNFTTGKQLIELCEKSNKTISQIMVEREISYLGQTKADIYNRMSHSFDIMKDSVKKSLTEDIVSLGGLLKDEAKKVNNNRLYGKSICGNIISKAISYSLGVIEVSASMGLIVAAPTAGSSGIIPGTFLAIMEEYKKTNDEMVQALFNAGAIGYLIMNNATVAGAQGGCQAEVGSASAMASSAITELMGGTARQCLDSACFSIINTMGLVCDPIAGLVEEPCQKRNAMGVSNAFASSELALSQIKSIVPFDEVVDSMYKVGRNIPPSLRETAKGGLAVTPTGCSICKKVLR